jgi:hypothetical protein
MDSIADGYYQTRPAFRIKANNEVAQTTAMPVEGSGVSETGVISVLLAGRKIGSRGGE